MLLVKTKLGPSSVHGIGLFADQFITKGTKTWECNPVFDVAFTREQVSQLPDFAQERFFDHSYLDKKQDKYILCGDDLRFINHSTSPNILSTPDYDIAAHDIQKGEELLCNYNHYEEDYFERRSIDEKTFNKKNIH